MATYSYGQLEGLWTSAGGSAALAPIMAAIALAESSGNASATNPTDNNGRQTSWGLWQISNGTHSQPVANILDPNVNAEQAVKKYKSQGLGAWGTYTSGAYKKFLKNGVSPITVTNGAAGSTSATNGTDASLTGDIGSAIGQGFASAFTQLLGPVMETIIWGVETMVGGTLMIVGLYLMARFSEPGKKIQAKGEEAAEMVVAPEAAPEIVAMNKAKTASKAPVQAAPSVKAPSDQPPLMGGQKKKKKTT